MRTRIITIDPIKPEKDRIALAAGIIRNGGLVAFPTETVYGIGANALDPKACLKIFRAKGRPADNPLIVHISSLAQLRRVAVSVPRDIERVLDVLWPGPVTFVLKKSRIVAKEATAGLESVAVRMPAHPIALRLIEASGVPIAAPSANTSSRPSPTDARHVIQDLDGKVDMIIDGGATLFGIESTVIDATTRPYTLLRPGAFTVEELQKYIGKIAVPLKHDASKPKSPGTKYRHYAPRKRLVVMASKRLLLEAAAMMRSRNVAVLCSNELAKSLKPGVMSIRLGSESNLYEIARNLFGALRALDRTSAEMGFIQSFPKSGIGFALMDRIVKASGSSPLSSKRELERVLGQDHE
jgi:L-threonylcarbamoyladenylate synthase